MSRNVWMLGAGLMCLGAGAAYLSAPPEATAAYVMNCSSNDGGRRFCPADTRRGATLVRQISQSPCIQGQTWGWDRRGVWVDRGCRADFRVFAGGGPVVAPRPAIVVNCNSNDMRRHFCGIPERRANVRLVRQRSESVCRRGYSWGTNANSIWVDLGCRADFEVRF